MGKAPAFQFYANDFIDAAVEARQNQQIEAA